MLENKYKENLENKIYKLKDTIKSRLKHTDDLDSISYYNGQIDAIEDVLLIIHTVYNKQL